jgi:hypothetical protein
MAPIMLTNAVGKIPQWRSWDTSARKNLAMGAIKIWQITLYDGYLGKYNMIL